MGPSLSLSNTIRAMSSFSSKRSVTVSPPDISCLLDVTVIRGFHRYAPVEPVDAFDLPLPDLEDVANIFPEFAYGHASRVLGLDDVSCEQLARARLFVPVPGRLGGAFIQH